MPRFTWTKVAILMIFLLGVSAVSAQSSWKLVDAQALSDLTGASAELQSAAVAPDGSAVAWGKYQQFCLYTFADSNKSCVSTPEGFTDFGQYSSIMWSPDSKTLVFTEDGFEEGNDSDIWMFDVASGKFSDRTDDQYSGSITDMPSPQPFDYLPTWNPANGDLYFFRSMPPVDTATMALDTLPPDSSNPKQINDLSAVLPVLSVYRSAAISPDGTQIALCVVDSDLDDTKHGVWVVNLKDGTSTRVATTDEFQAGMPAWAIHPDEFPEIVEWAGNNALVVWAENEAFISSSISAAFYVDLKAKSVTPLADFTDSPDERTFMEDGTSDDLTKPVYRMPRAGIVTPDGSAYLYASYGLSSKKAYVWSVNLPPDGSAATQIGVIDPFDSFSTPSTPPAISADGKNALLLGYWLTLQPPGT